MGIMIPGSMGVECKIYTSHIYPALTSRMITPLLKIDVLSIFRKVVLIWRNDFTDQIISFRAYLKGSS